MSVARTAVAYARLRRDRQRTRASAARVRDRRVAGLVAHAYRTVPLYRSLLDEYGIRPEQVRSAPDLAKLPVIDKRDLQRAGEAAVRSSRYPEARTRRIRTTGSTGRPFTLLADETWLAVQRALFLRALTAAGYRPGDRVLILSDDPASRRRLEWLGWRYVSYREPPETLRACLDEFRPRILYGWVTPLRRLALEMAQSSARTHRPGIVITTAEALEHDTRKLLGHAFNAEVFQFYGLTEMGMVATECVAHHGLHLNEETLVPEFPAQAGDRPVSLILTNLSLRAMPLIRYRTGDLVTLQAGTCPCGWRSRRLARIEGREVDCLALPGGRRLLPYDITLALERVPGLRRFQVVQPSATRLNVRYEGSRADEGSRHRTITEVLRGIVGTDVHVDIQRLDELEPEPGRKFRIIESRVARETSSP